MKIRISSSGTFLLKYLLPAIWIIFTLSFLILNFDDVEFVLFIQTLGVLILLGIILYFLGFSLHEVYYDKSEDMLIVKHFKKKFILSHFSVVSLFETYIIRPKFVIVTYRNRFGKIRRFIFIPRTGMFWPFNNAYIDEMRQWINQ